MRTERAWLDYGEIAEGYERIWAPRFSVAANALVAHAGITGDQRVLDVATGTGVTAQAAREAAGEDALVIGVDISGEMLRAGQEARDGIRVRAEVLNLPFSDGAFDAVLCSFGLHLFTNHETALHDMIRVVRPEGTVGVATWGTGMDEYQRTWQELVSFTIGDQMLKDVRTRTAPGAARFATPDGLKEALREAGLRKLRVETMELRMVYRLDEYVDGLAISGSGRFVRQMLGQQQFDDFMDRVRKAFRQRFPDPLQDFNQAILGAAERDPRK